MPLQVFISYAHHDDLEALDNGAPGFVSTLWRYLEWHFKRLGPATPYIWRDDKGIRPSDEFGPVIENAINASHVLLVVLSNNWLSRPYCRLELETFQKRWRATETPSQVSARVIPVVKSPVAYDQWPPLLANKQGYVFFDEDESGPLRRREFFDYTTGKPLDEYKRLYHARIEQLATDLHDRADALERGGTQPATAGTSSAPSDAPSGARRIFVAQPAADMRESYGRVVTELEKRGFAVVPDAASKIPLDSVQAADEFIDAALAGTEASVHLLGRNQGPAPDAEDADPIARLQLRRAGEYAERTTQGGASFFRFIWAPRFLPGTADDGAAHDEERDPEKVLERFGASLPGDQDKIEGCEASAFVEVVLGYLDRTQPETPADQGVLANSRVYLHCREDDVQYALRVGKALQQRNVEPVKPIFRGDPAEIAAQNRARIAACDAVVLCWGNAPETWVSMQPDIWRDFRSLGRDHDFRVRGLAAGPPSDDPDKEWNVSMAHYDGIDRVLDLRQYDTVPPEALDPLFDAPSAGEAKSA